MGDEGEQPNEEAQRQQVDEVLKKHASTLSAEQLEAMAKDLIGSFQSKRRKTQG